MKKGPKPTPIKKRFLDKVAPMMDDRGCWEWTAYIAPNGYGYLGIPGRMRPSEAHRVSYEIFTGPIPKGLQIDHLCRNRSCVNPKHLEAVTTRENLLRGNGWSGRHARKEQCPQGHKYDYVESGSRRCRQCRTQQFKEKNLKARLRMRAS